MNEYDNIKFGWASNPTTRLKRVTDSTKLLEILKSPAGKYTYNGVGPIVEVSLLDRTSSPTKIVIGQLPAFFEAGTDKKLMQTGKNKISPVVASIIEEMAKKELAFDFDVYKSSLEVDLTTAKKEQELLEAKIEYEKSRVDESSLSAKEKVKSKALIDSTYTVQKQINEDKIMRITLLREKDAVTILNTELAALEGKVRAFENQDIDPTADAKQNECIEYLKNVQALANLKEQIKKYKATHVKTTEKVTKKISKVGNKINTKLKRGIALTTAGVVLFVGGYHISKNINKNGGAQPNQQVTMQTTPTPRVSAYATSVPQQPIVNPTSTPRVSTYATSVPQQPMISATEAPNNNTFDYKYTGQEIEQTLTSLGYNAQSAEVDGLYFLLNPTEFAGLSNDVCFTKAIEADGALKWLITNNIPAFLSDEAQQAITYGRENDVIDDVNMYDMMYLIRKQEIELKRMTENGLITSEEMLRQTQMLELQKTVEFSKRLPRTTSNEVTNVKTLGQHPSYKVNA